MAQKSAAGLRSGFLLRSPTTKGPDDEALPPAEAAEDEETLCLPPPEPREAFRMSSMAEISFTRVAASMGRPLYPSKQKNCDKELLKDSSTKSEPRKLSISTKSGKPASPPPPPPVAENKKEKDASSNSHPPDPEQPKLEDPALPEALPGLEPEDSTERIEIKSMADLESCIERFKVECGVGQKKTPVKKDKKKKPSKPSKKESKQEKSADKAPKPEKSQSPPDTPPVPEPDSDEETPASVEDEPKAEVTFTCGICGKEIQQRKYEFFEYSCGQDYGYEVCVFNTHKNCLNERYKSRNPSLKDKTQWKNQVCVTDDCKELMLCVNLIHVDGTKKIYIKSDPPKKKDAQKEHELKKLEKKTTKNEEKRKTKKNGYQELKQPPLQAQEMLILTEKKDAAKPARPILSLAPRVAPPPPETTPSPQRRMAVPIRTVHLAKKKDEMEEKYFVKPAAAASRPQKVKKQKQLINIEVGLPYQQGSFQTGGFEEPQEPRTVIPDSWDSGSEAEAFQQQQAIPDCPLELTPLPIFQEPEYAANEFPFEMNSPLTYPYPGTAESVEFQQRIIRALEPLIEDIAANCPNSVYGTTEPISKLQKAIELLMAISPGLIEPAQAAYLKELFASDEPAPLQHFITGLKYFILYHYPDGWYFCKNEEGCKLEQQAVFCPMPPPTDRPLQSFADSKSPFNESFLDQAENPDYFETTTISSLSYADRAVQPPPTRNKRAMEQQPAVGVGSSSEILVDAVNAALAESMQDREEEINRSHYHHHQRFENLDPNQQCTMYGDHPANQAGGVSPSFEDRWYKLTREDSSCSDENPYLLQKSSAVGSRDWQPVHGSSSSGDTATLGPRSPTKRVKDLRKEYERTIRTLQHQVTEEIEQNEIHQDFVRNLRSQIEIAEQEALRKEQQHRLEMEHLHMRLNQQDKHFRSLQSQLEVNQYKETFRDLLLAERRDLQWIHSSINHLTIIIEALRPENNPLGRQMSRYHFQELKERYLEMEQVHLNNISILEGGSTNIQKNIPVPKLSPEVCQAVFMTEGVVSGPTKEYMDRWLPPISRAIENMAREADVPFPLRDSIECEVAKELQFQDCAVQFDLKVAIQRIAARLRVFKPVPAPPSPACPLSSERLSVSDETGPICEICHEALGTEGLFTCTLCKQPQHRGCIRGWFKRSTSCPHCRAQCVFDGDLTMEEGPSQSVF